MSKRYEEEQWRIEHADNATITFTVALHGPHAWEMRMEDSSRYHSISHGWATEKPHAWKNTIAPVLQQFFDKTPDLPIQTIPNVPGREIEAMHHEWFYPDPDMVTGSTLTVFRRQPHDPDAGLRQAQSCLREIVPVSMDEMTSPSAASDTGRRHIDGLQAPL